MPQPSLQEQIQALQAAGAFPEDTGTAKLWYENWVRAKLDEVRNGVFARAVIARIPQWAKEYSEKFDLLTLQINELPFKVKSFESVVEKLYRKVVLRDERPTPTFGNVFEILPDLVRLTLTSPYGDGPVFLADRLAALAAELGLDNNIEKRADEYGYYAVHFTYKSPVEILTMDTARTATKLTAEIQLTTQLQASLRTLTHEVYEARRLHTGHSEWRWDFENELFKPSYTGHTLHFLEGVILEMKNLSEARDKQL